jgi:putative ABC transport system permease protein
MSPIALAWLGLVRAPMRTAFVAAMTAIGMLAALLTAGYMSRTFFSIQESTVRGGVGHLQIATPAAFDGVEERPLDQGLTPATVRKLRSELAAVDGVRLLLPRLRFNGLVSMGERSLPFIGAAVDARQERRLAGNNSRVVDGMGLERGDEANPYRVVLGTDMARLLNVQVGDLVTIMSVTSTGGLNAVDAEISGITKTGSPQADRMMLQVPLALAQSLIRTDRISVIAVALEETQRTEQVQQQISKLLPDLAVRNWRELAPLYEQLKSMYTNQFLVLGFVLALMVALPIANMTASSISERLKDIGTLRALGVARGAIHRIFILEGVGASVLGACVAMVMAALLVPLLNSLAIQMPPPPNSTVGYPLSLEFNATAAVALLCSVVVIAALAAWIATFRLSRLTIVEALRMR